MMALMARPARSTSSTVSFCTRPRCGLGRSRVEKLTNLIRRTPLWFCGLGVLCRRASLIDALFSLFYNMVCMVIESCAHHLKRGRLACPEREGERALVQ